MVTGGGVRHGDVGGMEMLGEPRHGDWWADSGFSGAAQLHWGGVQPRRVRRQWLQQLLRPYTRRQAGGGAGEVALLLGTSYLSPCPPLTSPSRLPHPAPAGKLEAELVAVTRRVSSMLQKLPREITPVNLEELRRVKQALVELESKAENLRWALGGGGGGWVVAVVVGGFVCDGSVGKAGAGELEIKAENLRCTLGGGGMIVAWLGGGRVSGWGGGGLNRLHPVWLRFSRGL